MKETWKKWHLLLGWLMNQNVTPEEVMRAVTAYQKKEAESVQQEFVFSTG